MRSSSSRRRHAGCESSRATVRSAACARRFTTRCRPRASKRWSISCANFNPRTADDMTHTYRILTLNNSAQVGLKRLPAEHYEVGNQVGSPDAILVRSHDMRKMEIVPQVKAIGRAGAGTNNIPVKQMSARGVPVFNAPGANANAVKELAIAGILIAARNLLPAAHFVAGLAGDDAASNEQVEDGKKNFAGGELPKRTLGG